MNDIHSLAQGKYPWGIVQTTKQTANSLNRLPYGGRFLILFLDKEG